MYGIPHCVRDDGLVDTQITSMKYTYDQVADAIDIVFQAGKVFETREVAPGVMMDFDKRGTPLYLEILDAHKRFAKMPTRKAVSYRLMHSSGRISPSC